MKVWIRLLLAFVVVALLAALPGSFSRSLASPLDQTDAARQKARNMLLKLTPEEKVGQLFLVTFQGSTFDETSQIYDLILNHHIGGVMLLRANDNFNAVDSLPAQVYSLNRLLQESEAKAPQIRLVNPATGITFAPQYIPLLIGISQEGDSYPNDQILNGLTQLPDMMSIGATWNTGLAEQVGTVMGRELSALGFNLFIGPSLDVLDAPPSGSNEDLGVRSFGGSPYWVGKMGQSFIAGLHLGSEGRLMVIAKNFPGRGSSDRSPDDEIATVRKPIEELKQVDLAPFFEVTGTAPNPDMVTDGLLVSHIRYQGFQGTIRSTTRPVSSDSAAMEQILKLEPVNTWRENGGVLISDNLGSQAVRRFYDPTGNSFDARTAAREAFFAGNDLLYTDRFIATNDPDMYTTLLRTMDYFAQKYREDAAFAQRVDASVERTLTLKYRLYPDFNINQVISSADDLPQVGQSQSVTFDVARRSVTLVSPDAADLVNILPRPPEARDRIVFLTDVQSGRQCSTCNDAVTLQVDALQSAVMRLYGPRAGGQVSQSLMSSYGFSDLLKYLTTPPGTNNTEPMPLENDLKLADWVVVSMLKPNPAQPETLAFRRLLAERPDIIRNKKVVVFAFNGPYYLDATDISKLSAYYALYSKTPPFVDVAARILFQELVPTGALPVSVPGAGYELTNATSPDPTQVIPLLIENPALANLPTGQANSTQEPTPVPVFRVGEVIPLHTGVIYDRNHNPVPDGTAVRFVFTLSSESTGSTQQQIDTETVDGIARATYQIARPGLLEIHAASDQGVLSNLLRLDITSGVSSGVTMVPPTPMPTNTMVPTPTVTVTPTITATPTVTPIPASVHFQDWFFALLVVIGAAAGVSWFGIRQAIARWGLRWALCGIIGGMLFYNYLALKLPGSEELLNGSGLAGVLLITLIGVLLGWGAGLFWRQLTTPPAGRPRSTGARQNRERPATGPKSQSS